MRRQPRLEDHHRPLREQLRQVARVLVTRGRGDQGHALATAHADGQGRHDRAGQDQRFRGTAQRPALRAARAPQRGEIGHQAGQLGIRV